MAKKICLDPGHGGADSGAVKGSRKEKDDVLKLVNAIAPLLEAQGLTVYRTRTTDTEPTIAQRCEYANGKNADYFLSVHRNAGGGTGPEIWVHSQATSDTVKKAEAILDGLGTLIGKSRGVKKGAPSYSDFGVNTGTDMPSALLEVGFIDSSSDNSLFDKNFDKIAEGIAKGICSALGVTYKEKETGSSSSSGSSYKTLTASKGEQGSYVYAVKTIIKALNAAGVIKNGVDKNGIFGEGTEEAIVEMQKLYGLTQTGKMDDALLSKAYDSLVGVITDYRDDAEKLKKVSDILAK